MKNIFTGAIDAVQNVFNKAQMNRSEKRRLINAMKKRGATPEEIEHGIMLMDNKPKAEEVYNNAVKQLNLLGYTVTAEIIWHSQGSNLKIDLYQMGLASYKKSLEFYKKQEEEKEKKKADQEQATKKEDESIEKIKKEHCQCERCNLMDPKASDEGCINKAAPLDPSDEPGTKIKCP